ncbi:MAG TPA: class I SAM-dependent methyltransferase [Acidobacteriota bacterium]|nr:class I SAM-dependent methyltransferase [Acidobacteriota bacterium]
MSHATVLGNVYDKYASTNPFARLLFKRFLREISGMSRCAAPDSLLEVGCGEGFLAAHLRKWLPNCRITGIDLTETIFDEAVRADRSLRFSAQSIYNLAFPPESFDLVVGAEVLEHLDRPRDALQEIFRVSRRYALLSVPREPIWRIMNLARFAYWSDLGNTPGHLQHWTSNAFVSLVESLFEVQALARPLPWTVVLALKKDDSA